MRAYAVALLVLASCSFDPSGLPDPDTTNNVNNLTCDGDPPSADRTEGVCQGAVKVCVDDFWGEPDYTTIDGYEAVESSCDGLDNDCDGVVDAGACPTHAACDDSTGTPRCVCEDGWEPADQGCVDMDECLGDPCHPDATCENTPGSYSCTCNEGFEGDGLSCSPVDDCVGNSCSLDANCVDQPLGYTCVCHAGYLGDGWTCLPTSCHVISQNHPGTTDGTYLIDTGTGGPVEVQCDMTSDDRTGYTMLRIDDPALGTDQDAYRETCAAYGMEVIVPRTRAHARAIRRWNGQYPNLVNVFPDDAGATTLEQWHGLCRGAPCSFYLSNSRFSCGTSEPSGNNDTAHSLYLWNDTSGDYGCFDDSGNAVDAAFSGWVICAVNDNPEPGRRPGCIDYVRTSTVWNKGFYGISGPYDTMIGTADATAWCDQTTDGGGWTLVLNYLHKDNTNPALDVRTDILPLVGSNSLNTDESGTPYWGHAGNALLARLPVTEVRFYGATDDHSRRLHFTTADASCIEYLQTGTGGCRTFKDSYRAYAAHSANLPSTLNNGYTNRGDYALTYFPFYETATRHWGIGAGTNANRWEVDNFPNNDSHDTLHRVFVRNRPVGTSCLEILNSGQSMGSGFYPIDPDGPGGHTPVMTWCDMVTDGGGWTLVAIYGTGTPRPTSWNGATAPRPGASFYNSPYAGPTVDIRILSAADNSGTFASFSMDASALWAASQGEVLAYVGGDTDDYITATLPGGCNYFDASTWCPESTYGPFEVYTSDGALLTGLAYACTSAAGRAPFSADPFTEFGLHLLDGPDTSAEYHCFSTDSTLGLQSIGRLFTTFESASGSYWDVGVHSHFDKGGSYNSPGALFIR